MASDYLLDIRKAVIKTLRANVPLRAYVAQRVYEEVMPDATRPYVRFGEPIADRFEATGLQPGGEHQLTIHVFDEAPDRDRVYRIMDAVRAALDEDVELDLVAGAELVQLDWIRSQVVPEAGGPKFRHGVVQFESVVAALTP